MFWIISHLETNKLSYILQSAYRAQLHSTETTLHKVMNDILTDCDSGNVSLLNLLDLSAAFDTIDHSILLQRLEITFGVSGTALEWFKSYLSNRHQAVVIKGKKSSDHLLKYNVSQGSVLGPVLFILHTQPLVQEIAKFNLKCHFYADDTQLYDSVQCKNFEDLCHSMECCIKCLEKWMNENRLMLNDNKTEVLLTGSAGSLSKLERSSIHIGDSDIKFSNKVKNLGIHFDSDLVSSSHVKALIRTMYLELRKVVKIRHLINTDCSTLFVSSLVLSKLDYCNSLLAGLPSEKLKKKLQTVQNNAARLV